MVMPDSDRHRTRRRRDRAIGLCRHVYELHEAGSAVAVLGCVSCGATTLEFRSARPWTHRDQRLVDRYYIRGEL
jgi:hypothetical protein